MKRVESDPAEKYCWTLLKPRETLFKNWKTWIWKRKKFFHFLNKEITTQTAQNFFFYYIWETPKCQSLCYIKSCLFAIKQNKISLVESCSGEGWTGKICAVVTDSHQDTIKYNVGLTKHTHSIEIARKNRLESF